MRRTGILYADLDHALGGEPIGEPTNHYGRLVSAAESAEQAKRKRGAVTGPIYPLEPLASMGHGDGLLVIAPDCYRDRLERAAESGP